MSLRGKAAIVGIGETPHRRSWPNRSMLGLCAEVAAEAIGDAGLRREDIDGLITFGGVYPAQMAEYIGIRPRNFGVSAGLMGSTSGVALTIAAAMVNEGIANYIMFVGGGARDPENPARPAGGGVQDQAIKPRMTNPPRPRPGEPGATGGWRRSGPAIQPRIHQPLRPGCGGEQQLWPALLATHVPVRHEAGAVRSDRGQQPL